MMLKDSDGTFVSSFLRLTKSLLRTRMQMACKMRNRENLEEENMKLVKKSFAAFMMLIMLVGCMHPMIVKAVANDAATAKKVVSVCASYIKKGATTDTGITYTNSNNSVTYASVMTEMGLPTEPPASTGWTNIGGSTTDIIKYEDGTKTVGAVYFKRGDTSDVYVHVKKGEEVHTISFRFNKDSGVLQSVNNFEGTSKAELVAFLDNYFEEESGETVPEIAPEEPQPEPTTESVLPSNMTDNGNGTYTVVDSELGETIINATVVSEGMVYRMYNPNSGEHFYTKDAAEKDSLTAGGWNYEEDASFETIAATEEDAVPVYRVYNPNSGLHHYTMEKGEALSLKNIGWNYEGISLYVYNKYSSKGSEQYRMYNPNDGQHHWTVSAGERDSLVAIGWNDEGIAWRVK